MSETSNSQEASLVDHGRTLICNQLDRCPGPPDTVTIGTERFRLVHHPECPMFENPDAPKPARRPIGLELIQPRNDLERVLIDAPAAIEALTEAAWHAARSRDVLGDEIKAIEAAALVKISEALTPEGKKAYPNEEARKARLTETLRSNDEYSALILRRDGADFDLAKATRRRDRLEHELRSARVLTLGRMRLRIDAEV